MAHPRYWQPEKREFSDDEMYYVIYAQHNGICGLECAERLGMHPGVVNSIYEARCPYMDQAIRVGRRVQFDRTEEPNCERRRLAAEALKVAVVEVMP